MADHYRGATSVWIDERHAGRIATRHLLELGHRRIAHVSCNRVPPCRKRTEGFQDAMAEAHVPVSPAYVLDIGTVPRTDVSLDMGRNAAKILLSQGEPPTAVFAYWAEVAAGILLEARDRGLRVPEDLAIIGVAHFQEHTESCLPVPMTQVWFDFPALARRAVRELLKELNGEPKGREIRVEPELRPAASTQP